MLSSTDQCSLVAAILCLQKCLVEFYDLNLYEFGVELTEIYHCANELVLKHEFGEWKGVLGDHLV